MSEREKDGTPVVASVERLENAVDRLAKIVERVVVDRGWPRDDDERQVVTERIQALRRQLRETASNGVQ